MKERLFILGLFFFCFIQGCSAVNQEPTAKEIENNLQIKLPGYYEVTNFTVQITENVGSAARPVYKTKFKAEINATEDLYFIDNESLSKYEFYPYHVKSGYSVIFLKKTVSQKNKQVLYGIAVTKRQKGAWEINFEFENDAFQTIGKPLGYYQYITRIVSGTEEEAHFFKNLDTKANKDMKLAAEQEKKRAEQEKKRAEEEKKRQDEYHKQQMKFMSEQGNPPKASITDVKIYKYGKEPKLDNSPKNDSLFPTSNLTKTPFFIKSYLIDEKTLTVKSTRIRHSGTSRYKSGVKKFYLRILLMNPVAESYKNLYISIQHFVYDNPHTVSGTYSANRSRDKVKIYCKKLYRLKKVPGNQKLIIDTDGIDLSFSEYKFLDDGWDRTHGYDDTCIRKTGEMYAGYIISIFQNKKLMYQRTNSRDLKDSGIKSFNQAR